MIEEDFASKSYLIVDDFVDMRAALRSILRSLGVSRIDQARDGTEAIAQMEKNRYDVVLCDYNLGSGKDGQQVLEEARLRELIGIDCIFVMVTAENTRDMVMGAVEYAPDSYLAKPFTKDLLKARLGNLFERKADLAPVNRALVAKDYGAAIAAIDTLLSSRAKYRADLLKLKAEICTKANRHDEALAIYQEVVAERDLTWAHLGIGKALFYKKKYEQAREVFTHLVSLDRDLLAAYDWLAKTQMAQQEFDAAEATLQLAVKLSPRGVKRQQLLGDLALSNGHHEVAENAFGQAVALARHSVLNHPALFSGLAKAKTANTKHSEALKVVGDLGKRFPEAGEAGFYSATTTAIILKNQDDQLGAQAALQAAEQVMGRLPEDASSRLYLEMVKTCAQLGDQERASEFLHKAIANNHDDEEFLTEVMLVCREAALEHDPDTVIRRIQQSVVKTNNEGVRLIKQGEFDAAIKLLHQAAEEMPANKTINLNAAKAGIMKMERMGPTTDEIRAVRRYLERVQRAAPDDWRLADVKARLQKLATRA